MLDWLGPAEAGPCTWFAIGSENVTGTEVIPEPVADVGAVAKAVGLCV